MCKNSKLSPIWDDGEIEIFKLGKRSFEDGGGGGGDWKILTQLN